MAFSRSRGLFESTRVLFLPTGDIVPNPGQPRARFSRESLEELADSIREHGILQPLSVRRLPGGQYELISGERRLRAAGSAGLTHVPCILVKAGDLESSLLALVENLQRRDLDKHLLDKLLSAGLTERHGRALLRLPPDLRGEALDHIVAEQLTVAKTEAYIDQLMAPPKPPKRKKPLIYIKDIRLFLNTLNRGLGMMNQAGVGASCGKEETEDEIVLTITIPKTSA